MEEYVHLDMYACVELAEVKVTNLLYVQLWIQWKLTVPIKLATHPGI